MNNRINRLFGLVLFSALGAQVANAQGAGPQQNLNTGHYYEVIASGPITWTDAQSNVNGMPCLLPNGTADATCSGESVAPHLATITSSREETFVDTLRDTTLIANGQPAQTWIGGIQDANGAEPGGGWQWVNGEGSFPGANGGTVYTNWNAAEPNDAGGEDHLALGRYGLGLGWNDELESRDSIRGYIVEWDTPLIAEGCVATSPNDPGCTTIIGQTLAFPENSNPNDATISFNSFEFLDPRVDSSGKCSVMRGPLTIFGDSGIGSPNVPVGDPGYRPPMIIPEYLCGSPNFVVVALDTGDLVIETGIVGVENDTATVLPANVYLDGGQSICEESIDGDPQYQDVGTWQDTEMPTKMVEGDLGGSEGYPGLLGEYTDACGSSRMRVRGGSYFGIGFHIDFGPGNEWLDNAAGNFESFVALERYKLVLLEQSVKNARSDGAIGGLTNWLLRFNVARAIKRLDQNRYQASLFYIRAFEWVANNFNYSSVPELNYNGDHIMRSSNAEFTMRVKIIPYAGP